MHERQDTAAHDDGRKKRKLRKENVEKGFPGNANITSSTPLLFYSFIMVYFKLLPRKVKNLKAKPPSK
jgi:hypothetical protein